MGEHVRIGLEDRVATIVLDRPPANAITRAMADELRQAARRVASDEAVRAVVVWGGEQRFAAGADIKEMASLGPDEVQGGALEHACRELEAVPKVTIAAICGFALGGGCEIALACDLRIAAQDAKIGLPEIGLGIIPGAGGTQRLPRLIGLARARELVLTGRPVDASAALSIGLVDRVVAATEVYPAALDLARRFAAGPTRAYAAAKRALAASGGDLEAGLRAERAEFVRLFDTHDRQEGMRAFIEKREPRFEGR
jgi:enoyl-CoA hydratase/carnithine racemase